MMSPWPFFSKKFLPFVFFLGYFFVTWTSVTAIDPQVFQTDSLDFVQEEHRSRVQQVLGTMFIHVEKELPGILKEKPPLTLLSCAAILFFNETNAEQLLQADRGQDTILMGKQEIFASRQVFCANHRTLLKQKTFQDTIGSLRKEIVPEKGKAPTNEELFKTLLRFQSTTDLQALEAYHCDLFKEMESRQTFLITQLSSTLNDPKKEDPPNDPKKEDPPNDPKKEVSLKQILREDVLQLSQDESSNAEKITSYVAAHIDDGEGAAVDVLLMTLKMNAFYIKFQGATTIYPLVYTERDPCRCCLISIRDYLTEELRKLFPSASLQIIPIVLSNSVYHEPSTDKTIQTALRYCYPWWPPPDTLQKAEGSDGVPSDFAYMDTEVESTQLPLPTIFLYHMPLRQMVQLKTERK